MFTCSVETFRIYYMTVRFTRNYGLVKWRACCRVNKKALKLSVFIFIDDGPSPQLP